MALEVQSDLRVKVEAGEVTGLWVRRYWVVSEVSKQGTHLGKGSKKKKKKYGIFHKGGGVPPDFGSVSILFFFIFKHGLNHPEMQRNFFLPLGDPPPH